MSPGERWALTLFLRRMTPLLETQDPKFPYRFRLNQLLWIERVKGAWVRGKVQQKFLFEGKPYYRIVVMAPDRTVTCLVTAREHHFQKEPPTMVPDAT